MIKGLYFRKNFNRTMAWISVTIFWFWWKSRTVVPTSIWDWIITSACFYLASSSTAFSTSTSNILDRLSLPPYKPNHLPQKAEELLKTLVNPIGKKMKLDFYLWFTIFWSAKNFPLGFLQKSCCMLKLASTLVWIDFSSFFRFWTVRRIFASGKFPRIRTLFWSPSYKKCDCLERSNNQSHMQSPSTWKSHGMITFDYF